MILCFKLSMPVRNSWDGNWTGERNLYLQVIDFRGTEQEEKARAILEKGYFVYKFKDGWVAGIDVFPVDDSYAKGAANRLRRKSAGFCGYDWMVTSIIENLEIVEPTK